MDGNNSDWLNDTLPENANNNENVDNSSNLDNNIENVETSNNEETKIVIKENAEEPKEIPTLSGMANKVKEEEEPSEEEKYLLEYIGPNAEKLTYKVFSVPGFFFTSLYMLYRKVYLVGFITLLIQFALMFFIHPFVGLLINVITGIFFNTFYLSHCNRKIEKIKNKTASKDFNNVINLCGEKGGVNKGISLLGIIFIIGLVLGASYLFPEQKNAKIINDFINNNMSEVSEFFDSM